MEYNMMYRALGTVLNGMVRKKVSDPTVMKKLKTEYREIVLRASDIGAKNTLLSSYALAAYFIAMNRSTGLSAEENLKILESGMRNSKLLKAFMGSGKDYFSEKRMEGRRQWSKETHEKKYANDWVVDILEKTDDYDFGYDYLECGVCKLCRDEGCPELAKYLCSLDFLLVEIMGIKLDRTMTLAEGADHCDFRFRQS